MSDLYIHGSFRFNFGVRNRGDKQCQHSSLLFDRTLFDRYNDMIENYTGKFEDFQLSAQLLMSVYELRNGIGLVVLSELSQKALEGTPMSFEMLRSCNLVGYYRPDDVPRRVLEETSFYVNSADFIRSVNPSGPEAEERRERENVWKQLHLHDGSTLGLPKFQMPMKWNCSIKNIIEASTGSLSAETSSSSPSMMLHQICSLLLARSLPHEVIFEEGNLKHKPDLLVTGTPDGSISVDITSRGSVKSKMISYGSCNLMVIIKDALLTAILSHHGYPNVIADGLSPTDRETGLPLTGTRRWFSLLMESANMNDSRNWDFLQSLIDRQKAEHDNSQLFSPNVCTYFSKENQHILSRDSKLASEAFKGFIKGIVVKEELGKCSMDPDYNLTKTSWLRFPMASRINPAGAEFVDDQKAEGLVVVDDTLQLSTETTNRNTETETNEFFSQGRSDIYLMDKRAHESLIKYERMPDKVPDEDMHYYNHSLRQCAPKRNPNYYRERLPGKVKLSDPKDPSSDYMNKPGKPLTNLFRFTPVKPMQHKAITNVDELMQVIMSCDCAEMDQFEMKSLTPGRDTREFIQCMKRNKVYHLLTLFRRAAEALSFSYKDNSCFVIRSPCLALELHIYVSGSVMQTDKGMAYVSLVSNSALVKTWVWRSADVKNYKVATCRLISTCRAAWSVVPRSRRVTMVCLYSLIILENSWGLSKVLKPYRYLVTGLSYNSPSVTRQWEKFQEAMDENREMCRNKMSLQMMLALIAAKRNDSGTPILGLPQESMGYEAFLMNLCPSNTYGKRRHQVDMLLEIKDEIELSRRNHPTALRSQAEFEMMVHMMHDADDGSDAGRELAINIVKAFLGKQYSNHDDLKGRFTFTPISVLLIYPQVRKLCSKSTVQGTAPALSELMTMKASFDPINFKNASALESISALSVFEGHSTTTSIAISLLGRIIDLTFRMFDKDQQGGNREISIMSAEFRILQALTESFAKKLGFETGIDMLDNPGKVNLLCSAQNKCGKLGGIRESIDQTRWGPNFNTVTFAYMFALFSRYTTEAFFPLVTCVLAEQKVFQMLPYPELAGQQKTGTTLMGLRAPYHMGQGIFHYSSSLYHSLVHGYLAELRIDFCSDLVKNSNWTIEVRTFVTSDDVAIVSFLSSKNSLTVPSEEMVELVQSRLELFSQIYGRVIMFFGIKTSDYKNMSSRSSFEFNSIFLNKESVGSNSLKFLYSLVDPFTSGDQKRDMRKIFDSFVDSLNSSLTPEESLLVLKMNMKTRLLQWGAKNDTIDLIATLYNSLSETLDCPPDSKDYAFPILCTTQTITRNACNEVESVNVLPYKKYSEHKRALDSFADNLSLAELVMETENKKATLSRAKKRRLGSNRGLVLSKSKRAQGKIYLPILSRLDAIKITGPAYLALLMKDQNEQSMLNPADGFAMVPATITRDMESGFQMKCYKTSDACAVSARDLLYSSYDRVPSISSESTDLQVMLHIGRKHKKLKIVNASEYDEWSFFQRLVYFDEIVSNARASGSAQALVYNHRPISYTSFHFPVLQENISFYPSMMLPFTTEELGTRNCDIWNVYHLDKRKRNYACNYSVEPVTQLRFVSEKLYELRPEDLTKCAIALLKTDSSYSSSSARKDKCYMNLTVTVTMASQKGEIKPENVSIAGEGVIDSEEARQILSDMLSELGMAVEDLSDGEEQMTDFGEYTGAENEDTDPLDDIFGSVDKDVKRFSLSIPCPRYMLCLGQPWFKKHAINNANLYSLIDQGFVQNSMCVEPVELIYSILENARQISSKTALKRTKRRIHLSQRLNFTITDPDVRLASLSNIKSVMRKCAQGTYLTTVVTGGHRRIENLMRTADSAENLQLDQIEGLPAGITISDRPLGRVIERSEVKKLMEINWEGIQSKLG